MDISTWGIYVDGIRVEIRYNKPCLMDEKAKYPWFSHVSIRKIPVRIK